MAVMWEAVFLHALDQVVPIRLEVALSNGGQPDFGLNSIAKEQDCRSSVTSRACRMWAWTGRIRSQRSEEHTSELQSLMRISYAVFCLKNKTKTDKRGQTHMPNNPEQTNKPHTSGSQFYT